MRPRPIPQWLTQWEYAHRGLHSSGVPENSIAAARAAIDAGMGIECDIQRSCDGHPMVFHDWELDRLTHASGPVTERSRGELEGVTLRESGESIASLARFSEDIRGRVPLLVEVKSKPGYDVELTCACVSNVLQSYPHDHAVMSFDPRVAKWFRKNAAQTVCGLVMREDMMGHTQSFEERREALDFAKPDFLGYHIASLPNPWVAELRASGLPVLTWTVNTPETRRIALQNADALIAEGEGLA